MRKPAQILGKYGRKHHLKPTCLAKSLNDALLPSLTLHATCYSIASLGLLPSQHPALSTHFLFHSSSTILFFEGAHQNLTAPRAALLSSYSVQLRDYQVPAHAQGWQHAQSR